MKVLLVDDDAALSGLISEYLASGGIETTAVFSGLEGERGALSGQFDVMILDVMLPGIDGIELLRRIRRVSSMPIIMLTAKGGDIDRVLGLELGADDYVPKPYFPRELVARLRAVTRRHADGTAKQDYLAFCQLEMSVGRREVLWRRTPIELTTSEFYLLERLLRAGDVVSTKAELSLSVLGRKWQAYDRSVDVHVSNLRKKLATTTGACVEVETVRGVGYRLRLKV
jgi:two-component system OmpR family response regulator